MAPPRTKEEAEVNVFFHLQQIEWDFIITFEIVLHAAVFNTIPLRLQAVPC